MGPLTGVGMIGMGKNKQFSYPYPYLRGLHKPVLLPSSTAINPDQDVFIVHIPLYSRSLLMTQQPILLRTPPFSMFPSIPGLEIF